MIRAWAQSGAVKVVATSTHQVLTPDRISFHVRGMTNAQEDTIKKLFGPQVPRGKIFLVPLVFDVKVTVRAVWNVMQEFWRSGHGMPRKISETFPG